MTTLLWTARIESWRLKETCYHSNSSEKPSANTDVKNSKGVNDPSQNTRPSVSKPKEGKLPNCGLGPPSRSQNDNQILKKRFKYLDLTREQKQQWNIKVMVFPIVTALGTISKVKLGDWKCVNLEEESRPSKLQLY